MTFNANYDHTEYKALKALEGKNEEYAVWFGGTETASSPDSSRVLRVSSSLQANCPSTLLAAA